MSANEYLNPESVLIPGRGIVLSTTKGPVKTSGWNYNEIKKYLPGASGTNDDGELIPIGYTSLEDLPVLEPDVSGGEKIGVWENPNLRHTPISIDWSLTVNICSFNDFTVQKYFGKSKNYVSSGKIDIPTVYQDDPQTIVVGFKESDERWLAINFWKCTAQPAGEISADPEGFMTMPIKFMIEDDGTHDSLGFIELAKVTY